MYGLSIGLMVVSRIYSHLALQLFNLLLPKSKELMAITVAKNFNRYS